MLAEDVPRIVAVVRPGTREPHRQELLDSVRGQTRRPDEIRVLEPYRGGRAPAFAAALTVLGAETVDWWWLLDGAAIPDADALERLLEPLDDLGPLPSPALLAGKIVDRSGALDRERAPWPRLLQKEVSIDACQRRLVSVRAACHGSLLVHRRVIEQHGPPRADYIDAGEDLEWTARALRAGETGYLVPASVAVRLAPTPDDGRLDDRLLDLRNRVNMIRGSAWDGEEKLWFGFLLAQDLARQVQQHPRPRMIARTVRAVADGLLRVPTR